MPTWCAHCGKARTSQAGIWCKSCKKTPAWEAMGQSQRTRHDDGAAKAKELNEKWNPIHNPINGPINGPIQSAERAEKNRKDMKAYQEKIKGIKSASDEQVDEYVAESKKTIDALMDKKRLENPDADGFAVTIYVTSTANGELSVKEEGQKQFYSRGRLASGRRAVPPIRITGSAPPHAVPKDDMDAHAGPGVPVFDAKDDKVAAVAIETALHRHYIPMLKASRTDVPIQLNFGGGTAQGMGPYVVGVRAIPMPLPDGWSIRTARWEGLQHALDNDVFFGGAVKAGPKPAAKKTGPAAKKTGNHPITSYFATKKRKLE